APRDLVVVVQLHPPAVGQRVDERHPPPALLVDLRVHKGGQDPCVRVVHLHTQSPAFRGQYERAGTTDADVRDDVGHQLADAELRRVDQFVEPPSHQVGPYGTAQAGDFLGERGEAQVP